MTASPKKRNPHLGLVWLHVERPRLHWVLASRWGHDRKWWTRYFRVHSYLSPFDFESDLLLLQTDLIAAWRFLRSLLSISSRGSSRNCMHRNLSEASRLRCRDRWRPCQRWIAPL